MTAQKLITFILMLLLSFVLWYNFAAIFHDLTFGIGFFALLGWIKWFSVNIQWFQQTPFMCSSISFPMISNSLHTLQVEIFFSHKTLECCKFVDIWKVFIINSRGINFVINIELVIVWQRIVCILQPLLGWAMYNEHLVLLVWKRTEERLNCGNQLDTISLNFFLSSFQKRNNSN